MLEILATDSAGFEAEAKQIRAENMEALCDVTKSFILSGLVFGPIRV